MIWIYYLLYGGRRVVSQCLTGNLTVLSSICSGENDYIYITIIFPFWSVWSDITRRLVLPLNTRCFELFGGKSETECFNIIFLCIPCFVRDILVLHVSKPVVVQVHRCVTVKLTGCGFDSHSRTLNIYYFHFVVIVYQGKEGKQRHVEFRHLTRNASKIRRNFGHDSVVTGTECINTRFLSSLYLPCYKPCVRDTA